MAETTVSEIPDYPRGITFEQVWAALMQEKEQQEKKWEQHERDTEQREKERELKEKEQEKAREERERERELKEKEHKEKMALEEKKHKEKMEKWEKESEERKKEFEEFRLEMKESNRKFWEMSNRFGEIAEHLVAPGIADKFNDLGYHFDVITTRGAILKDENGRDLTEIDILLENCNCIMAVEVKTRPRKQDIEHHIKRLEIMRKHGAYREDKRKICGAIAGAVYGTEEKEATIAAGFYVLEQSGDTMKIDIPNDFVPGEW